MREMLANYSDVVYAGSSANAPTLASAFPKHKQDPGEAATSRGVTNLVERLI